MKCLRLGTDPRHCTDFVEKLEHIKKAKTEPFQWAWWECCSASAVPWLSGTWWTSQIWKRQIVNRKKKSSEQRKWSLCKLKHVALRICRILFWIGFRFIWIRGSGSGINPWAWKFFIVVFNKIFTRTIFFIKTFQFKIFYNLFWS